MIFLKLLFLQSLNTLLFASSCNVSKFYNSTSNACESCDPSCGSCTGPLPNHCSSCISGLTLNGSYCLCQYNEYFDVQPQLCKKCHVSCSLTCTGPSITGCSACLANEFSYQNSCFSRCLSTEFFDTNSSSCKPCSANCLACTGSGIKQCLSCLPTFVLYQGECLSNCPSSFYASDGVCKPCEASCLECSGPSFNECLSCSSNKNPTGGVCIASETMKTYAKNTLNPKVFIIGFDRDISNYYSFITSHMNVTIIFHDRQPPINYGYSLSLLGSNTEILIQLSFHDYLLPSNFLYITLPNLINQNQSTILIQGTEFPFILQEFYPYTSSDEKAVSTSSEAVKTTSKLNSVYSLFSSLIFKSFHSIRSGLIDSMLNCFIFMNIYFPPNFVNFAKANLDGYKEVIPNFFKNLIPSNQIQIATNNHNSQITYSDDTNIIEQPVFDIYLSTKFFFINYGSNLSLFFMMLVLTIICETSCYLLKRIKRDTPIKKILNFLSTSFRWNLILNEILTNYQLITFFALLGLYNQSQVIIDKSLSGIVLIFAVITLVICCVFSRKVLLHYTKFHEYNDEKSCSDCEMAGFFKRIQILHNSLKSDRLLNLMFFNILLVRSLIFPFVLIFLAKFPSLQLAYLLITSLVVIYYLIKFKPIKKRFQQIITLLYELMLLISITIAIILHIYNHIHIEDIGNRNIMGFMMISTSIGMNILNLVSLVSELYDFVKRLRQKARVITMKAQNNSHSVVQSSIRMSIRSVFPLNISKLPEKDLKSPISNPKVEIGFDSSDGELIYKSKTLKEAFSPRERKISTTLQQENDFSKKRRSVLGLRKSFKVTSTDVSCNISYNFEKSQDIPELNHNIDLSLKKAFSDKLTPDFERNRTLNGTYNKAKRNFTLSS